MAKKANEPQVFSAETLMLGYLCIKDLESLQEQVKILDRFGLTDSVIGAIVGRKDQAIRDARYANSKSKE